MGVNDQYHVLDPTTPWYEYLSYQECCKSLGVNESMNRFIKYNNYYRSVIDAQKSKKIY